MFFEFILSRNASVNEESALSAKYQEEIEMNFKDILPMTAILK